MRLLDQFVDFLVAAAKWLALPIVTLLFLQWPLRSIVGLYSREANDLGQWLFAFYVAVSITAATRAKTHLAADTISRGYSDTTRRWLARAAAAFGLVPWSIIVLITGWSIVRNSTLLLERFPDTGNPGYFIVKLALLVLALLVLIEGTIEIVRPRPAPDLPGLQ
ncbi:MAG: TRAP transporter small permease subunit [Xanthobacteraceae bacterium]|jgi:TRAP-type mannitol/chloroaromatic compound transport system permease small subunit